MKKSHKIRNGIIGIVFVLIVAFFFSYGSEIQEMITHEKANEREELLKREKNENGQYRQQITRLNQQVSDLENDLKSATDPNGNDLKQEESNKELLKDFAKKWVNFESIGERNASVKSLLSEKAIKENAINSDPKVEFKSSGKVQSIAKKDEKNDPSYILLVDVEARKQKDTLMIKAEIKDQKIDWFSTRYLDRIDEG
ncbi:EF0163 family protein [Enterococcus faecalis]|uniref:EF0163 family protein n=1 Tax=Enterococcus faecalis TaxID=1351 RepID=UPI001E4B6400|nr:EF0163 family protein [Enterococcus faecalis]MCD4978449.1 hypothetical protein [Enterococcus faecalis]